MTPGLIITIVVCLALAITAAILVSKKITKPEHKRIILLVAALLTVLCHYSSLAYHAIGHAVNPDKIGTVMSFLSSNPNLVLPIYPCNIVMWGLLILALIKNENSKSFRIAVDFLFFFGIVSGFFGLVANGDYFNPNVVKNYDIYKSAVAHGFMIFNILLLPLFGYIKLNAFENTLRTLIGTVIMGLVGLYCSAIELVLRGKDLVVSWNAMFLFRSPFDGIPFLKFYIVMPIFIVVLLGVLTIIELFKKEKGKRWFNMIDKVNL